MINLFQISFALQILHGCRKMENIEYEAVQAQLFCADPQETGGRICTKVNDMRTRIKTKERQWRIC